MPDLLRALKALARPSRRVRYAGQIFADNAKQYPGQFLQAAENIGAITVTCPYTDDFTIDIDLQGRSISESIISEGHYQLELMEVLSSHLSNKEITLVNVGANIGTTALNAAAMGIYDLILVEPVSKNFDLLTSNMMRNNIQAQLHKCAAGSECGTLRIYLNPKSGGRHSAKSAYNSSMYEDVCMLTVDSLEIKQECIFWIDSEGYELQVLLGACETLKICTAACIEVTPAISGIKDSVRVLEILQGSFSRIYGSGGQEINWHELRNSISAGQIEQTDLICLK